MTKRFHDNDIIIPMFFFYKYKIVFSFLKQMNHTQLRERECVLREFVLPPYDAKFERLSKKFMIL